MATQVRAEIQRPGAAAWEPLFAWRDESAGKSVSIDPSSWTNGTTKFRLFRRDTATGLESAASTVKSVTVAIANPVAEPFLVLDGMPLRVPRGRFRRLPDEVALSGARARVWEADVNRFSDADAEAVHALASFNLRRTIGGQLRGQGAGDVVLSGRAIGGAATVRVSVERDEYAPDGVDWFRTLSLRLREQVAP